MTAAEVVAVYTRTAPMYDVWARLTEARARRQALELAQIEDGEAVLEVAVGTGLAFTEILRHNPRGRNEGVDLTEAMLARARAKAEASPTRSWRLSVGDAHHLDFPDASFDLIINCYMFDLLPAESFPRVLAELHRVLKPTGRLVLVNLAAGEGALSRLWSGVFRLNPAWVGGCRPVSLERPLRATGFSVQTREQVVQLGVPSEVIVARKGPAAVP